MRRFLNDNILIFFLINLGNLFNYLFQIVIGRSLTPDDYGMFNSLNSLVAICSTPVAIFPMVYAKFTVIFQDQLDSIKGLLSETYRILIPLSAGVILVGALAIPWLMRFLHVESYVPIAIMLVLLALSFLFPVLFGVIQGLQRFFPFGIASCSLSFIRLASAGLLVFFSGIWSQRSPSCKCDGNNFFHGICGLVLERCLEIKSRGHPQRNFFKDGPIRYSHFSDHIYGYDLG